MHSKKTKDSKAVSPVIKEPLVDIDTSQSKIVYDTMLVNVIDEKITISAKTDLEGQSVKVIPLDLPLKSNHICYGAYWIGVGDSNHAKYKLLEQTMPGEWAKLGVTIPLGAYALGKLVSLPESTTQQVDFMIGTAEETAKIISQNKGKIPASLRISSFQKKFDLPRTAKEKQYLLISNQHLINAYEINVKFIVMLIIENRK